MDEENLRCVKRHGLLIMLFAIQVTAGPGEIALAGMTLNALESCIALKLARARSYLYLFLKIVSVAKCKHIVDPSA